MPESLGMPPSGIGGSCGKPASNVPASAGLDVPGAFEPEPEPGDDGDLGAGCEGAPGGGALGDVGCAASSSVGAPGPRSNDNG